jgi:glucose/arabinose dehydrogenase
MKKVLLLMLLGVVLFAANGGLKAVKVVWGMDFVDKDRMILTTRDGRVFLLDMADRSLKKLTFPVKLYTGGQGGLLDVKVSPTFHKDRGLFFTYSKPYNRSAVTVLAKATLSLDKVSNLQEMLVSDSASSTRAHFGSRIAFDDQGHIFFTIGDRGVRENAQNLTNHAGSVIRLRMDGSTPADNPFVGQKNRRDEIYSYGHRNPQGIFYDQFTKRLWAIEHGPRGGDEINLIEKGKNYGWPIISYGREYRSGEPVGEKQREGMEQAKKYYVPSIAPSSLILYRGDRYLGLNGKLLAGALVLRHINVVTLDQNANAVKEERIFEDLGERIRHIVQSPDGWLYFSTDSGHIYRIVQK